MKGSRWATAAFIVSALWRTNGSCIWPEPKSSPTTFMPSSSRLLMMSRGLYFLRASLRWSMRLRFSPSMMWRFNCSSRGRVSVSTFGDAVLRQNFRGVDDGAAEAGLAELVEECGIEHDARGGFQAEGDVGEADD